MLRPMSSFFPEDCSIELASNPRDESNGLFSWRKWALFKSANKRPHATSSATGGACTSVGAGAGANTALCRARELHRRHARAPVTLPVIREPIEPLHNINPPSRSPEPAVVLANPLYPILRKYAELPDTP